MKKVKRLRSVFVFSAMFFALLFLAFASLPITQASASETDGTIDATYKYAWGENVGWINFGNAGGNIHITDTAITGYAWIENYGWINMDPANSGVTNNAEGDLSGYAWGENVGWIDFSNVSISSAGVFGGTAEGDITGTISFACTNCSVKTDWRPESTRDDGDGGGGAGNTHYICNQNQCQLVNWAGTNECQNNDDCSTHYICNSLQKCVTTSGVGSNLCTTDANCVVTHTECSSKQCLTVNGLGVSQCTTNADCGEGKHNECNSLMQCVLTDGVGSDLCQTNADCAVTHNECSSEQCTAVSGVGISQCQTNIDCIPERHNECNAEKKCVAVDGVGSNLCQTNTDCVTTHNECVLQQCIAVSGDGVDQCQVNSDCQAGKHNECNSSSQCVAIDGSGPDLCQNNSDCVVTHKECINEQCIDAAGVGVDQCQFDVDCRLGSHNECNSQSQCVSVLGQGNNTCQTNADCGETGDGGTGGGRVTHNVCEQQKCILAEGEGNDECQTDENCKSIIPVIITETVEEIGETIAKQTEIAVEAVKEEVKVAAKEVKKAVETPQGSAVTKTVSTTGAIVTTAATATTIILSPMSLIELFLFPLKMLGILLTAFGIKRRATSWGVVYDSVTKQPLDPAYVTLLDLQGKDVSSAITDLDGRYGFLIEPKIYKMTANKTNYAFPSQKLLGRASDELYNNLYFGEEIEIKNAGEVITKNIPMDPVKFDWNEFAKKNKGLMKFYSNLDMMLRKISDFFFVIGFVVAVIAVFAAPYPYNTIIMVAYLVLLLLRILGVRPKAFGNITEKASGNPLSFAILRIMSPSGDREISHKVADQYGRYYCLVPKGQYYVKIEKKNDDGSYSLAYTSQVIDASKKGIIKEKFKI